MDTQTYTLPIRAIRQETKDVWTLQLEPTGNYPKHIAGQYITVLLPGKDPVEGKAYSISSAPYEEGVCITVKRMGQFSDALCAKQVGDTLRVSPPYGFFYPEAEDSGTIVCIAGGIGITPCISIIKQHCHTNDPRPIHLYYSNRYEEDILFADELRALQTRHCQLQVEHFITRQENVSDGYTAGRMYIPNLLQRLPTDTDEKHFFVCGSMHFTREIWKELCDAGVAPEAIYTEGFF